MSDLVGNPEDRSSYNEDQISASFPYERGKWGRLAQWLASRTTDQGVPRLRPGRGTVCCGLEQVTLTYYLVLVKTQEAVDRRLGLSVTRLWTMLCLMC